MRVRMSVQDPRGRVYKRLYVGLSLYQVYSSPLSLHYTAAMRFPIRYNAPMTQVVLVALVCFATVGMYSAVQNLGAGGTQNIQLSDKAHVTLYTLFAAGGLVAGAVNNILGPRWTLFIGTLGYAVYVSALWVYQTKAVSAYLIVAGGIQGLCAALLWSAQGAVMMAYPSEAEKGRAFSLFWGLYNCGALLGSLIALAINIAAGAISKTATGTYVAFFTIIICGVFLSLALLPPTKVIRRDGSVVAAHSYASPKEELHGMWFAVKQPMILLLIPMFFSSNYFYTYQQAFAFALFDAQTRALNGLIKAMGQILGGVAIGIVLDKIPVKRRRTRGLIGIAITSIFIIVAWAWGVKYQLGFTRETKIVKMHWSDPGFGQPIAILVLYDIGDAMYQGIAYWIMGASTNDPQKLARYAGLYKAIQSAGTAVAFGVDAAKAPYLAEILSSWMLLLFSLPFATYVTWKVKDTCRFEEEPVMVGMKETEALPVEVPASIEKEDEARVEMGRRDA